MFSQQLRRLLDADTHQLQASLVMHKIKGVLKRDYTHVIVARVVEEDEPETDGQTTHCWPSPR